MKVWKRKTITYSILKVIKTFFIDHIYPIQLDRKVVDCVFNDYPRGGKDYELLKAGPGGSKFINYDYITFHESC